MVIDYFYMKSSNDKKDGFMYSAKYGGYKIELHFTEKSGWKVLIENEHSHELVFFANHVVSLNVSKQFVEAYLTALELGGGSYKCI